MSLHKQPLTVAEAEGLKNHGLPIGTPSQLSDSFRLGMAWAERVSGRLLSLVNRKFTSGNDVPVTQVRLSRSEIDEELQKQMPDETPAKPLAPLTPGDVVITPRNIRKVYLGADGEAIFSERMRAHCVGNFSAPFRRQCLHEGESEFPEECPWCDKDGMVEDSVKVPVEVCRAIYQAMVNIAPQAPLCEDEGCPQHGSDHVCMSKPLGHIRCDSLVAGTDTLHPDRPTMHDLPQ